MEPTVYTRAAQLKLLSKEMCTPPEERAVRFSRSAAWINVNLNCMITLWTYIVTPLSVDRDYPLIGRLLDKPGKGNTSLVQ